MEFIAPEEHAPVKKAEVHKGGSKPDIESLKNKFLKRKKTQ